jgi:hypothetical protein
MIKVYASEMLDYVVDEGVQIHGGYGYHQDYAVERAYRDSRINRIFEGTNEINRLLIAGMLLKRAARDQLPLTSAVEAVLSSTGEPAPDLPTSDEGLRHVRSAKRVALLAIGVAYQKYREELEKQQEVLMNLSDIIMEAFAMDSTLLRSRKLKASGKGANAGDMTAVFLGEAMSRVGISAQAILGACSAGKALRENLAALRRLTGYDPVNAIALRRAIASRLLAAQSYLV